MHRLQDMQHMGSVVAARGLQRMGSIGAHGLSCLDENSSMWNLPGPGIEAFSLHWQVNSYPLYYRGCSPVVLDVVCHQHLWNSCLLTWPDRWSVQRRTSVGKNCPYCLLSEIGYFRITAGLPWWLSDKESTCSAGDTSSVPRLGQSLGGGNCNPLQYSCLKNPMDWGALQATVQRVAESDMTERLSMSSGIEIRWMIQVQKSMVDDPFESFNINNMLN